MATGTKSTTTLKASDFASTTKLPSWASSYVEDVSDSYAMPTWDSYQKSVDSLKAVPAQVEESRKASEIQYYDTVQPELVDQAKTLAYGQAAKGTTNSSVGSDQIASFAKSAFNAAIEQQSKNVTAAESRYQNVVDTASATQGYSEVLGEYLAKTQESYGSGLSGFTFDSGDTGKAIDEMVARNEGTGTYDSTIGFTEGEKYFDSVNDIDSDGIILSTTKIPISDWNQDKSKGENHYNFNGQEFDWDPVTGTISNLTGKTIGEDINAADLAKTSSLEDFAKDKIKEIYDKYGTNAMAASSSATNAIAGTDMNAEADTLNKQYTGLSSTTMALLKSALGSAQGAGISSDYQAARGSIISDSEKTARQSVNDSTAQWKSGMQTKQASDSVNANSALSSQILAYLGLTQNKYEPDSESYWSYIGSKTT